MCYYDTPFLILQSICKIKVKVMKPINFPQSTKVLQRPSTMAESECQSLPVWNDGKQCVSCWKPTFKERLNILFSGKVWLGVLSGKSQPPVFVSGECVFQKTPIKAEIKAFFVQMVEWFTEWAKRIAEAAKQPDKRFHFVVGFLISLFVGTLMGCVLGFLAGSIAGIVKEWWNSKGHGTVEKLDAVFTVLGAACAIPLSWLFHFLIW